MALKTRIKDYDLKQKIFSSLFFVHDPVKHRLF